MYKKVIALVAVMAALLGIAAPASADPQGFIDTEAGVGFFYGTFNQSPTVMLLVGGKAEDFCAANPDDPFNGEPGVSSQRVFFRGDGSVDLKVNDKEQPIYLYETEFNDAPPWIGQVCSDLSNGAAAPNPFATGTADLKVRVSVVSENLIDVFNSVNGTAVGTDGRQYKVRAWADLIVENGMPVGDPQDFVGFKLTEIRR